MLHALVCALQAFDFWPFKTVESKYGHSNVCYLSVFSGKCGIVYYAVHDGSSSRPIHKIVYYGVNWHKLK